MRSLELKDVVVFRIDRRLGKDYISGYLFLALVQGAAHKNKKGVWVA